MIRFFDEHPLLSVLLFAAVLIVLSFYACPAVGF